MLYRLSYLCISISSTQRNSVMLTTRIDFFVTAFGSYGNRTRKQKISSFLEEYCCKCLPFSTPLRCHPDAPIVPHLHGSSGLSHRRTKGDESRNITTAGADDGSRTHNPQQAEELKSSVYANSTTSAYQARHRPFSHATEPNLFCIRNPATQLP